MNATINKLIISVIFTLIILPAASQKKISPDDVITSDDLQTYISFLASPDLRGRENGEPGLEIAQHFIVSQARLMGLKPANGNSYYQPYTIVKNTIDPDRSTIQIISNDYDTVMIKGPVYQLVPTTPADFTLEGEVIFAGYGLKQDKYGYNDFESIKPEGKILLVMNRAPSTEDGKFPFETANWDSFMSIQAKLTYMLFTKAKAILFVMDPKSGVSSLEERYPGISGELGSSKHLKGEKPMGLQMPGMPKILYVHRSVADELLKGTGKTLEELQNEIDSSLKPQSFEIQSKKLVFTETSKTEDIILNNVAAVIEGSDPELKNEYVIFSAHADHIGTQGGSINPGADDNASGCAALLSIAEAFQSLEKKPLRSVMFLWVSGEEIGLYGSKSYVNNPLVPLEKTIVDLNIDMIGRTKGVADTTPDTPMTGINRVFVITGNQSSELGSVASEIDKSVRLDFDYSLSGRKHPLQLFSRSDHYNFVKHDIPVLFFSSGIHTDYHTPGDVAEKIDFKKTEMITETIFKIGFTVADKKTRFLVDNPYSKW
ncbi:MAG: M28 family peptidase [Bacteroidota bacterium]